jgi:hypothetical protein
MASLCNQNQISHFTKIGTALVFPGVIQISPGSQVNGNGFLLQVSSRWGWGGQGWEVSMNGNKLERGGGHYSGLRGQIILPFSLLQITTGDTQHMALWKSKFYGMYKSTLMCFMGSCSSGPPFFTHYCTLNIFTRHNISKVDLVSPTC